MDLVDLISDFSTGSYTVTRRGSSTYSGGKAVPAPPTQIQIDASVQDPTGADLLRLSEERRSIATRVVFTTTPLFVGGQTAGVEADRITIDGLLWEVQNVETWHQAFSEGDGYRAIVQKVPQ